MGGREGRRAGFQGKWPFPVALLAVVALDLWTKHLAFAMELEGPTFPRVHWLCGEWLGLTQTENPGAVWGLGGDWTGVLVVVRLVVLAGILFYLVRLRPDRPLTAAALGLVSGGALGNLHDNFFNRPGGFTWDLGGFFAGPGKVRDFIHVDLGFPPFAPWPDFNVADAMILVGVALIFLFLPAAQKCAKAESGGNKGNTGPAVEQDRTKP